MQRTCGALRFKDQNFCDTQGNTKINENIVSQKFRAIWYSLGMKQYYNILIYCNIYYCNTIQ